MRVVSRIAFLLAAAVFVPAAHAQDTERKEVLATLDAFTQALRTRDTTSMLALLDSAARMTLLRPVAATGATRVWVLTGPQFVKVATNPANPALDEPIRNPVVQIDGPLATVWAEYQVRQNGVVTHCGFDAFQLVKTSERWKILNVSDTFRRTGCGPAWP